MLQQRKGREEFRLGLPLEVEALLMGWWEGEGTSSVKDNSWGGGLSNRVKTEAEH